jgi:hypothetical protein
VLTDEQYAIAKAKHQDRVARRMGDEETDRLGAVCKEYEDFQASIPQAEPETVAKYEKKVKRVVSKIAKDGKKKK